MLKAFLRKHHPEAIPFPGSRFYTLVSRTRVFKDHYSQIAQEIGGKISEGRILDAGTGPAHLLVQIARHLPEAEIVGIDLSEDMIMMGKRNVKNYGIENRIELRVMNVCNMSFGDETFDLVISTVSLHHWRKPLGALNEIFRVLKPKREAWIYDLLRNPSKEAIYELKKKYGAIQARLFQVHSLEEPFLDKESIQNLIKTTNFKAFEIEERGILFKVILQK